MATNNITSIKNYFNRHLGLQRSNRFDISFEGLPDVLRTYIDSEQFYPIDSVTLGNRAIEGVADNLSGFGNGRIQPRAQIFAGSLQLIFPVTNDNHILKLFNAWFNYLYSGGRVASNGEDLTVKYFVPWYDEAVFNTKMIIRLLNPNGLPNSTFTFYEIMPVETMPILMEMDRPNQYSKFTVMMSYKEFVQT
jgi:hypothetical protein